VGFPKALSRLCLFANFADFAKFANSLAWLSATGQKKNSAFVRLWLVGQKSKNLLLYYLKPELSEGGGACGRGRERGEDASAALYWAVCCSAVGGRDPRILPFYSGEAIAEPIKQSSRVVSEREAHFTFDSGEAIAEPIKQSQNGRGCGASERGGSPPKQTAKGAPSFPA